eukprot:CAMPEP_0195586806 /NCGR_PEP_ID=MMETSP0814-20130614/29939_1 /TAXON_ID=97485 /ORGANISM="Prymnesium parvum, Strain Texoma1" /LENGTH=87 /DNA_ID=CAMNT_0040725427 /DNA_START=456 /DNA_END=719 /DNA_ORIENTATION=-
MGLLDCSPSWVQKVRTFSDSRALLSGVAKRNAARAAATAGNGNAVEKIPGLTAWMSAVSQSKHQASVLTFLRAGSDLSACSEPSYIQ